MDSKKIEIRPCPTYRSTGQDSCRRPDRVIVAEHALESPVSPLENAYAAKGSMKTNAMVAILLFMIFLCE